MSRWTPDASAKLSPSPETPEDNFQVSIFVMGVSYAFKWPIPYGIWGRNLQNESPTGRRTQEAHQVHLEIPSESTGKQKRSSSTLNGFTRASVRPLKKPCRKVRREWLSGLQSARSTKTRILKGTGRRARLWQARSRGLRPRCSRPGSESSFLPLIFAVGLATTSLFPSLLNARPRLCTNKVEAVAASLPRH